MPTLSIYIMAGGSEGEGNANLSSLLENLRLGHLENFQREKVTVGQICKLSYKQMECLGVNDQRFSRGTLSRDVGEGRKPATSGEAFERTSGKERLDLPYWMDLDSSNLITIKFPVITRKLHIVVTRIPRISITNCK